MQYLSKNWDIKGMSAEMPSKKLRNSNKYPHCNVIYKRDISEYKYMYKCKIVNGVNIKDE